MSDNELYDKAYELGKRDGTATEQARIVAWLRARAEQAAQGLVEASLVAAYLRAAADMVERQSGDGHIAHELYDKGRADERRDVAAFVKLRGHADVAESIVQRDHLKRG